MPALLLLACQGSTRDYGVAEGGNGPKGGVSGAGAAGAAAMGGARASGGAAASGGAEANGGNAAGSPPTSMTDQPRCGDGMVHVGEECDDGANNSNTAADACRTSCQRASCGDGVKDGVETCDEGQANSDTAPDACNSHCTRGGCGNQIVDSGETCDQGAKNSDILADACRSNCQRARCGDGVIDSGETCDEAAQNSDTAFNACRTNCAVAHCGDGVKDAGEACDEGASNGAAGANACSTKCGLPGCGNGVTDALEQCDDGAANSDSAPNACRKSCQKPRCGDLVVDTNEACDQGPGNSDTQADACRKDCKKARCGDNVADTGEECDGGTSCASDCKAIRCGNSRVETGEECEPQLTSACTAACRFPVCGNGVIEPGEVCDDRSNDGKYGGCNAGCKAKAPYCGDSLLQTSAGEKCEPPNTTLCDSKCQEVPPSCVPSGSEQCFNGVDDDCNSLADCADPACNSKAVCVPSGPRNGILVPVNMACPQGFTNGQQTLHQGLTGGSCVGCGCSVAPTQCGVSAYYYATAAECTADTSNTRGIVVGGVGTTCPSAPQVEGTLEGFRATITTTLGQCTASGAPTLSTPTWSTDKRLCVTTTMGAGCSTGSTCVPVAPTGGTLCAEKSGTGSCPSGFNQQVWYDAYTDTRSCTPCGCTRSGGDCSKIKVQVGSDWSCLDSILLTAAAPRSCTQSYSPPITVLGSPTNGTCTSASSVMGSLTAAGAHTFCCK